MSKKDFSCCALILAAGKGTRMYSSIPKVLQPVLDKPIIHYILNAVKELDMSAVATMIGHSGEEVEKWINSEHNNIEVLWQRNPQGTGHAVKLAQHWWKNYDNIMILAGDTPLLTGITLKNLLNKHITSNSDCTFLSFIMSEPHGYGRVIRDGTKIKIIEEKDASDEERECQEVNSGIYVFNTERLLEVINNLTCNNQQKEYYLTEALSLIQKEGSVSVVKSSRITEFLGVNNPLQLAEVTNLMRSRILEKWMLKGIRVSDPNSTWIGDDVEFGTDVFIEPNVQIYGRSYVGTGSRIGSYTVLNNVKIGENVKIIGSARINDSIVNNNSTIGPFVFIREKTEIMEDVLIGRFVEIKKSIISNKTKIPHLSYIGDTKIGKNTNIGAGTITCNYDGTDKHNTLVGDDCFIGSNTIIVAPVTIADKATTAAGSTITKNVPESSLAISREKQKIVENWYLRRRKKDGGK